MPPKAAKSAATASKLATASKRRAEAHGDEPDAKRPAAEPSKTTKLPSPDDASKKVILASRTKAAQPDTVPKPAPKRKADSQPKAHPAKKKRAVINEAPTHLLNVYVFGEGSNGELGLGPAAMHVKRPRLNPLLAADKVGVVQIAVGGMHAAALTHDNKIYTWGVNDQGACGRDTSMDVKLTDINDKSGSDDSDDDEPLLNAKESTPTAIDPSSFPEDTKFVHLAAGDSMTFALTDEGLVYGWGTFRSNEGILGFTKDTLVQRTPALVPELSKVTRLACGANHVLALTSTGAVYAWGSGQQNQLGRRVVERTRLAGLTPREFGLPKRKITQIACGAYHAFAIDTSDNVYAWGLNSYGECGIFDNAGQDDAVVPKPQKVRSLSGRKITNMKGGAHHSIAVTEGGECLLWGRCDGAQVGMDVSSLPSDRLIFDEYNRPRILKTPTAIPGLIASFATCESDHNLAIARDGRAWSWGFSATFQTGQGTDDDIQIATVIDNTAVRGKRLNWAGAGGQYSMLTSVAHEDQPMVNGV